MVASDLEEEAPIWYLRVKAAAERGAKLIVANARPTKLERYAAETMRYTYGNEIESIESIDLSETENAGDLLRLRGLGFGWFCCPGEGLCKPP